MSFLGEHEAAEFPELLSSGFIEELYQPTNGVPTDVS